MRTGDVVLCGWQWMPGQGTRLRPSARGAELDALRRRVGLRGGLRMLPAGRGRGRGVDAMQRASLPLVRTVRPRGRLLRGATLPAGWHGRDGRVVSACVSRRALRKGSVRWKPPCLLLGGEHGQRHLCRVGHRMSGGREGRPDPLPLRLEGGLRRVLLPQPDLLRVTVHRGRPVRLRDVRNVRGLPRT